MLNNYIPDHKIEIHDEIIDYVQYYIYHWQKIGAFQDQEKEAKSRIRMEWSAFGRQLYAIKSKFSLSLKRNMFNQFTLPILT